MPPKRGREESKSPEPNQKRMREEEMGIPEPRRPANPQGLTRTFAYQRSRGNSSMSPMPEGPMERDAIGRDMQLTPTNMLRNLTPAPKENSPKENSPKPIYGKK